MIRRPSFRAVLWFVALALIVVRTGEAHLHLCLEGGETSFHAADLGSLCADGLGQSADASHSDQDVDLDTLSGTLAKSDIDSPPFAALPPFELLALLPPVRSRGELFEVPPDPRPKLPYLFLPQFRGPPV